MRKSSPHKSYSTLTLFSIACFLAPAVSTFVFSSESKHSQALAAPMPAEPLAPAVLSWCADLSHKLLSVNYNRCVARSWQVTKPSAGGRVIPRVQWTDPQRNKGNRKILVLGALHGDEISSVSMVFRWLDFLDRTKPTSYLRDHTYLFYPLVNPDGFHSEPRTRTNRAGVDVNRNFSTRDWQNKALPYWKEKTKEDPRRYPGKAPASEIETQIVQEAIDEFQPDLIISVHAPYCLVDHDGPVAFPKLKSPLPVKTLGAFPGSLGTFAGVERNIPVITPELPSAKTMVDPSSIEQLFLFIMNSDLKKNR